MEEDILKENRRRHSLVKPLPDPVAGDPESPFRQEYGPNVLTDNKKLFVPSSMLADPEFSMVSDSVQFARLRVRHDFEYWAAVCAVIKDKSSGKDIPFLLNRPQRKLLGRLERIRLGRRPIRMIILKARQWGCSTLVQLYLAWLQIAVLPGRHAIVCAQVKDAASTIRGIYSKLLANYPERFLPEGVGKLAFRPFEKSQNTLFVDGIGSRLTVGSAEAQEAIRGNDFAFAHLSEVAFWRDTPEATPEGFIRAVCGAINNAPDTMVVMESTANGVGNYFHKEWLRTLSGKSDKESLFVPWYDIEIYSTPVSDKEAVELYSSMDNYERSLWELGLTLEQIAWYRGKRREYPSAEAMMAEYPTDAVEAFTHSGNNVFAMEKLRLLRRTCIPPVAVGDVCGKAAKGSAALQGVRFIGDDRGELQLWRYPDRAKDFPSSYVVGVDVGGRSAASDWSVISVVDRRNLEVVAQWRGHIDHDLLAWKSVAIAVFYCNAQLVIESNTLEAENFGGDPGSFILNEIFEFYPNLYYRTDPMTGTTRVGFHTNRSTKLQLVNCLIALVRECGYVERCGDAIDELAVYRKTGASFGALMGHHDDIVMSRALALFAAMDGDYPCDGEDDAHSDTENV